MFQKVARVASCDIHSVRVKMLVSPPSLDEDEAPDDEETWDWPRIITSDWRLIMQSPVADHEAVL